MNLSMTSSRLSLYETALANRVRLLSERWAQRRWHGQPFGAKPLAGEDDYRRLWQKAKTRVHPEIDRLEDKLGFGIDAAWLHELALHTQVTIKQSDICYQHGRVLYAVLSDYIQKLADEGTVSVDVNVVETGTARGFSATCMSKALEDMGAVGRILTFDLLPHDEAIYWNCIDDLEKKKSRRELLTPWHGLIDNKVVFIEGDTCMTLSNVKFGRIHFAFLDGGHNYEHVSREALTIKQQQRPGDVILFDDYSEDSFSGLVHAVDTFCLDAGYDKQIVKASAARGFAIARKL